MITIVPQLWYLRSNKSMFRPWVFLHDIIIIDIYLLSHSSVVTCVNINMFLLYDMFQ